MKNQAAILPILSFSFIKGTLRRTLQLTVTTSMMALMASNAHAELAPGPRLNPPQEAAGARNAEYPSHTYEQEELSLRALMLEEGLCSLQRPMRKYTYSWISGLSAALVIQSALALSMLDAQSESERATRAGLLVGIGMNIGGVAALVFVPKPELNACARWRVMASDPSVTLQERVAFGEARLARSDTAARRQTAWWIHGLAVVLGTAVGVGLGLGFSDNTLRATAQGIGTFALTEARILTRPTRARRFFREYRALRWAPTTKAP